MENGVVVFVRKRLFDLRKVSGLTQENVAELAGISAIYYQSIEAGRRPNISITVLEKLSEVYGLSMQEFFSTKLPRPILTKTPPPNPHNKKNKIKYSITGQ